MIIEKKNDDNGNKKTFSVRYRLISVADFNQYKKIA